MLEKRHCYSCFRSLVLYDIIFQVTCFILKGTVRMVRGVLDYFCALYFTEINRDFLL